MSASQVAVLSFAIIAAVIDQALKKADYQDFGTVEGELPFRVAD
jgi:hypothetical protein